jgi:cytochrome c oxidase cbb3-type subunit 1
VGRHDQRHHDAVGRLAQAAHDPILKFLIVSLSFYGMSTFEGPMMSIKTVNALSHYTDWTIGHVHSGALGWVGLISIGSLYYLMPRMFGRKRCTASS